MKKISMLKLLALVAIASVFTGCGCKNKVQLYLPQDFKDCFVFPEGSWWAYKISNNSNDTVRIENLKIYPPVIISGECIGNENFSASYSSKDMQSFFIENLCISYNSDNVINGDSFYIGLCWGHWNSQEFLDYALDTSWNHSILHFGGGVFGLKNLNEITVEEQQKLGGDYWLESIRDTNLFDNILEIRTYRTLNRNELYLTLQQNLDKLPPYKVIYARGIGLIKKEKYNGDIWTLEDYFINE